MIINEPRTEKENMISFGKAVIGKDYLAIRANEAFYRFYGATSGVNIYNALHDDDKEEFESVFSNLSDGDETRMLIRIKDGNGEYVWADMTLAKKGTVINNEIAVDMDIFFLTAVENRYLMAIENLNKYRVFLSLRQDYLFDYDVRTNIFTIFYYTGNQVSHVIKMDIGEFERKMLEKLDNIPDVKELENFVGWVKQCKPKLECKVKLPLNEDFSVISEFSVNADVAYTTSTESLMVGILSGAGDEEEIPYYATKEALDAATGVLNKRASYEYTQAAVMSRNKSPRYMIIIDVDNFKSINDSFGHLFGDQVLAKIAEILKRNLNGRGIVGRFGGDEFYVFTQNILTEKELRYFLTAVKKEVLYAYDGEKEDFHVTLSIGVSLFPTDGSTYEDLFKKADMCLYLAKNKGKNRFIIYDENKHGSISSEETRLTKMINPIARAEGLASYLADAICKVINGGMSVVPEVLQEVIKQFTLDGVRVCDEDGNIIFCIGDYKRIPYIPECVKDTQILARYNANSVWTVGNTTNLEALNKALFEELTRCNIMAMVSFAIDNKNGKRRYFYFDILNHTARWSESEKNYLFALSKVIAKVLI